jgi:hypothetical protein
MPEMKEFILKVGESAKIKTKLMGDSRIVYAGMPNKDTYSIVVTHTSGNNSSAYNLYFPLTQRRIEIEKKSLDVYEVMSDRIRLNIAIKT